jgi:hypothetical protein
LTDLVYSAYSEYTEKKADRKRQARAPMRFDFPVRIIVALAPIFRLLVADWRHAPHVDDEFAKNDRSMTMAAETVQMPNPRNSALSSRAQITDGSRGRCCGSSSFQPSQA